ncbi:MAG: hypothetical protein LBE49_06570, partial [Deltaproteobacteria bacterium]|nr:hypothetical protein [Deltaproteobacteria bacterium]
MAALALALAAGPAWLEHQARLAGQAPKARPAQPDLKAASAEQAEAIAEVLIPTPEILDQVKGQAAEKPFFDPKSHAYEEMIQNAARRHKVSPALIKAV